MPYFNAPSLLLEALLLYCVTGAVVFCLGTLYCLHNRSYDYARREATMSFCHLLVYFIVYLGLRFAASGVLEWVDSFYGFPPGYPDIDPDFDIFASRQERNRPSAGREWHVTMHSNPEGWGYRNHPRRGGGDARRGRGPIIRGCGGSGRRFAGPRGIWKMVMLIVMYLSVVQFVSSRGNEYFCEIDEDYLTDRFNLTGLNTEVSYYQYALDLVTDVFDLDADDDLREQIEKSARHLYGLVHARYIVTTRGLAKMVC